MSFLETMMQSPSTPTSSASVTQQTLPDWYTGFLRDLAGRGIQSAARPYTPYDGARVAGFSPLQQAGFGQVQQAATAGQPALQQAAGLAQGATNPWSSAYRDQYMSPYISGVTDEIARLGNQNFQENLMPGISGTFTGAGQFGSTRNAAILGRAARDTQLGITGQQLGALNQGYGQAQGQFNADQNRMLSGMGALGSLASMQQQQGLTGAQALLGAGGMQQAQQQKGLDLGYQDFQEQQGYDMDQMGKLKALLSGMQLPAGASTASSGSGTGEGTSPLAWLTSIINNRG